MSQSPIESGGEGRFKPEVRRKVLGALGSLLQVLLAAGIGLLIGGVMMNATGYD